MSKNKSMQDTYGSRKKKKLKVTFSVKRRIAAGLIIVALLLIVLGVRLCIINYTSGDKYTKAVLDHQQYSSTTIPYKRGQIVDCNGTVLAYSEKVYNLILDPKIILSDDKFFNPTVEAVVNNFELDKNYIIELIKTRTNSSYEKVLKELTIDQVVNLQNILADTDNNPYVKGVWLEETYIRKYPFQTLACDVIGFSSTANGGELGLESYYNESLTGTDGVSYGYIDEDLNVERTTKNAVDGNNVITTIDFGVQSIIEKHIKSFNETYGSNNTAFIVMNPNNGEIMGMASYPVFDLNNPRDLTGVYTEEELSAMTDDTATNAMYALWRNYCVSEVYEPGSTFKPITVASALEEGVVHDGDTFECHGYEVAGGWTIKCHQKSGHGVLTLEQAVMNSCNPSLMQIAAKLGAVTFAEYQARFGFGSKTSIDLPGEEYGITKSADMSESDLASNSFGQNLNVTMIQMVAAYSSIINGGNYYKPHMVKRIETVTGDIVSKIGAELVKQTVTPDTSELLKRYLKATVDSGTCKTAKVEDYSMAGKSGTAEKLPRGNDKYIISFLGHAPAENPKFVIYVVIDEPGPESGAVGSSSPVMALTKSIMTDLLPYMNVFRDSDEIIDTTEGGDEVISDLGLHD